MGTSTTMKLYTAVVLLSIAQVCYSQVCEVCGEGLVVTNLDEPVPLPGQNSPLTCEELQQSGRDGQIPESQCAPAAEFIFDICGCSPAAGNPTSPPVQLQPPTLAPTPETVAQTPPPTPVPPTPQPVDPVSAPSEPPALAPIGDAPTLGPGVNPPCSICGEGMRVTLMDPIVEIPGFDLKPSCEEFEIAGFAGQIPASNCPFVPSLVGELCACAPGGSPVSTPTTAPDPNDDTAICHVCGEASSEITIADATTEITGELLTCQELQTRGLAGGLKRAECPFVPMLIKDLCGCSEGTTAPAPTTPTIPLATTPTTGAAVCNICGVGNRVGDKSAVLNLSDQTVTCGDLEVQGLAGEFANGDCGTLPETIGTECQCEVDPDFTFNFTNSNSCLVCEENMVLTNPGAVIQLDGGEPQTCAELQEKGIGGSITRTDCLAFPTAIQDICGCKALGAPTMAPMPVVSPSTAPAPTDAPEPNCSGSQGTFGVESGTEYEMEFFYESVTTGNTVSTAIQNILTTRFEPALSAALLSGVFSSICSRRLQIGRRLDVVGISARPNDELLTNVACQTEVAAGNSCVVVRGLMTLYADDDSGVDDKMQAALERTQVSMENGAFDNLDPRMVAIRFRTEALPPSVAPTPAPDEPTEPGLSCDDASGTIGSDLGDANEVQFFYEVLSTPQTVTSALESILRTTFEPALIAALFSGLFSSVCSRRLAAAARRRLNVIGLKAKPNDELLTTIECSTITETDGNKCTVVRGLLTLYAEDGSDITEQKQATLDRTRVSMSNGAFDNLDSRLVQVRYRSETLDESGTKTPAPGPAPASPSSVPIWAWVLIGVGIFVVNVLICCFCMRRRRQNKEAEEDDFGYGGDPYGEGGGYGAAGGDYGGDASAAYSGQYSGQYEGEMEYAQPGGYQSAMGGGEAGGGEFDSNDQFYEQDNGFSSMGFTQSQPLSQGGGRDSFSDGQQRGGFSNPHDMMNSIGNL